MADTAGEPDIPEGWFEPGELQAYLGSRGITILPESPLAGIPCPPKHPGGEDRVPEGMIPLLAELGEPAAFACLGAVARPSCRFIVRKGIRREVQETYTLCADGRNAGHAVAVRTYPSGHVLLLPLQGPDLSRWVLDGLASIPAPEIPFVTFPPMSPAAFTLLLGLADLFRVWYPYPDRDWNPEEMESFTEGELEGIVSAGRFGTLPGSLVAGFSALMAKPAPVPAPGETGRFLGFLVNEGYLGLGVTDEGERYILGHSILWTLRCLAWWDRSLALVPQSGGEDTLPAGIYLVQATALWQIAFEEKKPDRILFQAVDGRKTADFLQVFFAAYLPGFGKTDLSPASTGTPGETGRPSVCGRCGRPLAPGSQFCGFCGAPLRKEEPLTCPACQKPVKPGSQFCGFCGAPLRKEEPLTCPACQKPVKPGSQFCGFCGAPLR
ncbi:MAG: zinc ribbon domain-containing protein, partial [Methanolinea sp.]|nr:zinc ribbon domain-containing protein [Methanolinea sp.]